MPCWSHEAQLATLSNTWFLCERCREAMRFAGDVAVALEHDTKASTSEGELADSLPKAGSGLAETLFVTPPSPPPGAGPERDPALHRIRLKADGMGHFDFMCTELVVSYLSNEDPGDQA